MPIRIQNEKLDDLQIKDSSDQIIVTMYAELCSFYYVNNSWIVINS